MAKHDAQPGAGRPRKGGAKLRAVQGLLLLFTAVIVLGGKGDRAWPLTPWPMYESVRQPSEVVSVLELHVTDADGTLHTCMPDELLTRVEIGLAGELIRGAFDDSDPELRRASRSVLAHRLRQLWPDAALAEAIELSWRPDPGSAPPLDREHPTRRVDLGRFRLAGPGE